MLLYKEVVNPKVRYTSETWTTYRWHLNTIEKFHQHFLWNIFKTSWEDRRTNVSTMNDVITTSIEAYISSKNKLRRTNDECLSKQIFYSQLMEGKWKRGNNGRVSKTSQPKWRKVTLTSATEKSEEEHFEANRCQNHKNNQTPILHLDLQYVSQMLKSFQSQDWTYEPLSKSNKPSSLAMRPSHKDCVTFNMINFNNHTTIDLY